MRRVEELAKVYQRYHNDDIKNAYLQYHQNDRYSTFRKWHRRFRLQRFTDTNKAIHSLYFKNKISYADFLNIIRM